MADSSRLPPSIQLPPFWRRHLAVCLIFISSTLLLVCNRVAVVTPSDDDWNRYNNKSFRVTRVVDGDTLDIDAPDGDKDTTRIRLWGVDTPEVSRGKKPGMYYGQHASTFAKETLTDREVYIVLSRKDTRGKYGRLLAYVFLERGGKMFNEMLIAQGYAYADLRFKHHYYSKFRDMEKRARRARVGLWADVTLEKMPKWKQRFERKRHPK